MYLAKLGTRTRNRKRSARYTAKLAAKNRRRRRRLER